MASATGIPEHQNANGGRGEEEPLLGRAGDASQQQNEPLQFNLVTGTAVIAQIGIWIVWHRISSPTWPSLETQLTFSTAYRNDMGISLLE